LPGFTPPSIETITPPQLAGGHKLGVGIFLSVQPNIEGLPKGPIAGGGAKVENLRERDRARIQDFVNRTGIEVTVIGSRASGTAHANSDFDYLIGGKSRDRQRARRELPRGSGGGEIGPRGETGIDIFNANKEALDLTKPHIIFRPEYDRGGLK
jgi:hypothetical protein